MADKIITQERALRGGSGAAATFTFFTLLVAVIALIFAWLAMHRANIAERQANNAMSRTQDLTTKVENAVGSLNKASSGAGSGQNTSQAIPSTNTQPNGNGQ